MTVTAPTRPGVTFARVLAAEWTKFLSVRSSLWTVVGTILAAASLAVGLGLFVRPDSGQSGASLIVSGYLLAQLGSLVLGVLVGTGEYAVGTFRVTFTAVPRRLPVLLAQALMTTVVAFVTAVGAVLASFLVTIGQRATGGLAVDLTDGETVRVLVGYVGFLVGVALVGLGIGALLRRPTAALVTGVLVLVVLDHLLAVNPGRVTDTVRALLPGAGARLTMDDATLTTLDASAAARLVGRRGRPRPLGRLSARRRGPSAGPP